MNFDYNKEDQRHEHAVAYIDCDGDLMIKDKFQDAVCLTSCGMVINYSEGTEEFERGLSKAQRLFFPGDTVQITF